MNKILFIVVTTLFSLQTIAAEQYDTWWKKGNDFYSQKQFDSAVFYYEKIASLRPDDATVYYNLGNAYYRSNKIGSSVLNYEKALHIDPNNKDAKDNLVLTQNRIANKVAIVPDIFFVNWWNSITQPSKAFTWAMVCLVLFVLILVLLWIKRIQKRSIPSQLTGFLWVCWVLFLVFAFFAADNATDSGTAVVMQNDAPLLSTLQGKTQSLVPEGTTVQIKDVKGNWMEVRLPDGHVGWMQQGLLSKI